MKSLKSIVVAGVVLVVLIVATVILMKIPKSSDAEVETSASAAPSETVYVINKSFDTLERFTVVPTERQVSEDTAYAYASEELDVKIIAEAAENGGTNYSYEVTPDAGKFDYNTSMFRSMMYTLTSISAVNLVEEDAKDLSMYGLDQPTAVIKTYYTDGSQVDIIIGSQAPVDENYYCMTTESNTVYTIGAYVDSLLVRRPIEYRDITLFPTYEEEDIYTNINWVSITNRKDETIEIQLDDKLENEYNTEKSQYVMLQPYAGSGNTSTIQANILDVVSTLTLGSIVRDITEEEYAEYGLDKPAKLAMTDISGNSVSLLIGKTCPNPDYTFCMLEGTDTLITCTSSAFEWMDVSYVQFMLRTIWTYNIEQLKSIDIKIGEEAHRIEVEHYIKQNANGNDTDGVTGTLDGQEIIETNVRRLFVKCLYFRIVDNLTEEEKKLSQTTDPYATITLEMEDGTHTLELIPVSDRKYAMRVDGQDAEYYCNKKSLSNLADSIGYVLEGDELGLSFG